MSICIISIVEGIGTENIIAQLELSLLDGKNKQFLPLDFRFQTAKDLAKQF